MLPKAAVSERVRPGTPTRPAGPAIWSSAEGPGLRSRTGEARFCRQRLTGKAAPNGGSFAPETRVGPESLAQVAGIATGRPLGSAFLSAETGGQSGAKRASFAPETRLSPESLA